MAEPLSYQVVRSSRKTISLEIRPDGSLLVRAPSRLSDARIREFVRSKENWIQTHLRKYHAAPVNPPMTQPQLEQLAREALAWFPQRTRQYAPRVGVSYGRITIRAQHTRWGSCSSQGNLNFNCLLMLAPEYVRDYVVVHELCHRKHMDHSPAFWVAVEQVLPDYRKAKQWLKENGNALLSRLPR